MSTYSSIGSVNHEDEYAVYYGGIMRNRDKESVGCLQYCTFKTPTTNRIQLGKIHSIWWCKTDRDFNLEVQPFPFVAMTTPHPHPDLLEVCVQPDTIEIPATALGDRIDTNVVWVPPSVGADGLADYVLDAPGEYDEDEDEDDEDEDEDEDEDDDDVQKAHTFYYRHMRVGKGARRKLVPAIPPQFMDGWRDFVSKSFKSARRPYWKHDLVTFVLEHFLSKHLQTLDPSRSDDSLNVFVDVVEGRCVVADTKRKRKRGTATTATWGEGSPVTWTCDQQRTLVRIKEFVVDMLAMKEREADFSTVYNLCVHAI
jgi:hypothetical protein